MELKNVLLITVDSLRADHLGIYGYYKDISPNLDKLAKKGIIFKNAISNAPYTKASFPAILTGTHPYSYGGYHTIKGRPNLAKLLNKHGYFTFAIPNIPILSSRFGYSEGFDVFIEPINSENVTLKHKIREKITKHKSLFTVVQKVYWIFNLFSRNVPYTRGEDINKMVMEILDNVPENKPFFGWIHYMDVHYPYKPPSDFLDKSISVVRMNKLWYSLLDVIYKGKSITEEELADLITLYDGEIRYVDYTIGNLIDYLKSSGLWENTIIIITADHGEEFMEHGTIGHVGKMHYTHIYDELLRVPLIISGEASPQKGIEVNSYVDSVCIPPTLLEILGIPYREPFEGTSLLKFIETSKTKPVLSEASLYNKDKGTLPIDPNEEKVRAYREDNWKIIIYDNGRIELFNIDDDPKETTNLADENKDIVAYLIEKMNNYLDEIKAKKKQRESEQLKKAIKNLKLKGKI